MVAIDSGTSGLGSSPRAGTLTRHYRLSEVPLSTQVREFNACREPCDGLAPHPGESGNTPSRSMSQPTWISSTCMQV